MGLNHDRVSTLNIMCNNVGHGKQTICIQGRVVHEGPSLKDHKFAVLREVAFFTGIDLDDEVVEHVLSDSVSFSFADKTILLQVAVRVDSQTLDEKAMRFLEEALKG